MHGMAWHGQKGCQRDGSDTAEAANHSLMPPCVIQYDRMSLLAALMPGVLWELARLRLLPSPGQPRALKMAGASAGSLAVVTFACGLDVDLATQVKPSVLQSSGLGNVAYGTVCPLCLHVHPRLSSHSPVIAGSMEHEGA